MGITTSSFKLSGNNPHAVAISNGVRGYWHVRRMKALAPPWALVKQGDPVVFRLEFMRQLQRLDPKQIVAELGEDAVMLCWEAPGEFCHRRLVAEWLETSLGIQVPELEVKTTPNGTKNGPLSTDDPLFSTV